MDKYNEVNKHVQHIAPGTYTEDKTDAALIDTQGYTDLYFLVNVASIDETDTNETYKITYFEGDLANGSDQAAIPTRETQGADSQTALETEITEAGLQVVKIPLMLTDNRKRYIRAQIDVGGTSPSLLGAVTAVLVGQNQPTS